MTISIVSHHATDKTVDVISLPFSFHAKMVELSNYYRSHSKSKN